MEREGPRAHRDSTSRERGREPGPVPSTLPGAPTIPSGSGRLFPRRSTWGRAGGDGRQAPGGPTRPRIRRRALSALPPIGEPGDRLRPRTPVRAGGDREQLGGGGSSGGPYGSGAEKVNRRILRLDLTLRVPVPLCSAPSRRQPCVPSGTSCGSVTYLGRRSGSAPNSLRPAFLTMPAFFSSSHGP